MSKDDYDIGFGKPPKHHRFKPGQSGNPKGRPKAPQALDAVIHKEMNRKVTLSENGERKTMAKREIIAKQSVNNAAQGNLRAINFVTKLDNDYIARENQRQEQFEKAREKKPDYSKLTEKELIELHRLLRKSEPSPDNKDDVC